MNADKKNKNISVPFVPGDDLYYVQTGDRLDKGPGLFEIRRQAAGISAIQVDTAGNVLIVDEASDKAEPAGGQWNNLAESDALEWAKAAMPGAVWLDGNPDGKPVTAIYSGPDGSRKAIAFGSTMSEIEELVCAKPSTMAPDVYGIMAIYDAMATKDTSPYSTFLNDADGKPCEVIYGSYLLVAVERDPDSGFYHVAEMPEIMLSMLGRKPSGDASASYSPSYWYKGQRMTVSMLTRYLMKLPGDATVHCCGADPVYLHYCPDTAAFSIDCESLEDLPEYEGRGPAVLAGPEA